MKILVLGGSGLVGEHFTTNSKLNDFMDHYKTDHITFWSDICRGRVGNIPGWIQAHIFSADPTGI